VAAFDKSMTQAATAAQNRNSQGKVKVHILLCVLSQLRLTHAGEGLMHRRAEQQILMRAMRPPFLPQSAIQSQMRLQKRRVVCQRVTATSGARADLQRRWRLRWECPPMAAQVAQNYDPCPMHWPTAANLVTAVGDIAFS